MSMRVVAAGQLGPASPTKVGTIDRLVHLVESAVARGVELLVFPELSLTTYFPGRLHDDITVFTERGVPPDSCELLLAVAKSRIDLVVPFAERAPEGIYNSAALIGREGREVGRYRKVHLPGSIAITDPERPRRCLEKRYFIPGNRGFPAYPATIGRVGMAICYDRRFPETFRSLALNGADIFAVCYNTSFDAVALDEPARGVEAHDLAIRSAAALNGIPLVAAGKAGNEDGVAYLGASSVVSHSGDVLARAISAGDELVVAEIDIDAAIRYRERLAMWANRRPDQYGPITALAPAD